MRDAYETLWNMYIMMECIQGGELFDHIKDYEVSGTYFHFSSYYRERSSVDNPSDFRSSTVFAPVWYSAP